MDTYSNFPNVFSSVDIAGFDVFFLSLLIAEPPPSDVAEGDSPSLSGMGEEVVAALTAAAKFSFPIIFSSLW